MAQKPKGGVHQPDSRNRGMALAPTLGEDRFRWSRLCRTGEGPLPLVAALPDGERTASVGRGSAGRGKDRFRWSRLDCPGASRVRCRRSSGSILYEFALGSVDDPSCGGQLVITARGFLILALKLLDLAACLLEEIRFRLG